MRVSSCPGVVQVGAGAFPGLQGRLESHGFRRRQPPADGARAVCLGLPDVQVAAAEARQQVGPAVPVGAGDPAAQPVPQILRGALLRFGESLVVQLLPARVGDIGQVTQFLVDDAQNLGGVLLCFAARLLLLAAPLRRAFGLCLLTLPALLPGFGRVRLRVRRRWWRAVQGGAGAQPRKGLPAGDPQGGGEVVDDVGGPTRRPAS